MEERKKQYARIKKSMDEFSEWMDNFLPKENEVYPHELKTKVEFIQREAFDLGLGDGWAVHIDIVAMRVVKRFCTVYGKDKFEAQANASAICRIENI